MLKNTMTEMNSGINDISVTIDESAKGINESADGTGRIVASAILFYVCISVCFGTCFGIFTALTLLKYYIILF